MVEKLTRSLWLISAAILALLVGSSIAGLPLAEAQSQGAGAIPKTRSAAPRAGARGPEEIWVNIFPIGMAAYGPWADVTDQDTLYVGMATGLFRTATGGRYWTDMNLPLSAQVSDLCFAQSVTSPKILLVGASGKGKGIWRSDDSGRSWRGISGGVVTGDVKQVRIDPREPNVAYAISDNGTSNGVVSTLFSTLDGGKTWANINPQRIASRYRLAGDPVDSKRLQMTSGGSILVSIDDGQSWQESKTESAIANLVPFLAGTQWDYLTMDPHHPERLAGICGNQLLLSSDGGQSWKNITPTRAPEEAAPGRAQGEAKVALNNRPLRLARFSPSSPDILYACSSDNWSGPFFGPGIYVTKDSGGQWNRVLDQRVTDLVIVDDKTLYASTETGILKSNTGGETWHGASLGLPSEALAGVDPIPGRQQGPVGIGFVLQGYDQQKQDLYVGSAGGYWRTTDGGASWDFVPMDAGFTVRQISPVPDGSAYMILSNQELISPILKLVRRERDGSVSHLRLDPSPRRLAISPADPRTLYLTVDDGRGVFIDAGNKLMKSTDGGTSWRTLDFGRVRHDAAGKTPVGRIPIVAVANRSSAVVFAVLAETQEILKSLDGGDTWKEVTPAPNLQTKGPSKFSHQQGIRAVLIDPTRDETIYVVSLSGVYRSSNGGDSWTRLAVDPKFQAIDITVSPVNNREIALAGNQGVLRSKDGGETWSPIDTGLVRKSAFKIVALPSMTVAQGPYGIYRLSDEILAWAKDSWDLMEREEYAMVRYTGETTPLGVMASMSESKGANDLNVPRASIDGVAEYFPIGVGSRWVYSVRSGSTPGASTAMQLVTHVDRSVEIGGKEYLEMVSDWGPTGQGSQEVSFWREGEDGFYSVDGKFRDQPETIQIPKTVHVGSTWISKGPRGTMACALAGQESLNLSWGRYDNALKIVCTGDYDKKHVETTTYLVRGVGNAKETIKQPDSLVEVTLEKYVR